MNTDEKVSWIVSLWFLSLLVAIWLGLSISDPTLWTSPWIMFGIFFTSDLVAWLFRITYLKGRYSR